MDSFQFGEVPMKFFITALEKIRDVIEADDPEMAEKRFRAKYPATTEVLALDDGLYPQYVAVGERGGLALRLARDDNNKVVYWRDAGEWGIRAKMVNGKPVVDEEDEDHLSHLNNKPLIEISRKEWAKDNSGYVEE
jgi:hypothetical protein